MRLTTKLLRPGSEQRQRRQRSQSNRQVSGLSSSSAPHKQTRTVLLLINHSGQVDLSVAWRLFTFNRRFCFKWFLVKDNKGLLNYNNILWTESKNSVKRKRILYILPIYLLLFKKLDFIYIGHWTPIKPYLPYRVEFFSDVKTSYFFLFIFLHLPLHCLSYLKNYFQGQGASNLFLLWHVCGLRKWSIIKIVLKMSCSKWYTILHVWHKKCKNK